jgi:hypothetical protein
LIGPLSEPRVPAEVLLAHVRNKRELMIAWLQTGR